MTILIIIILLLLILYYNIRNYFWTKPNLKKNSSNNVQYREEYAKRIISFSKVNHQWQFKKITLCIPGRHLLRVFSRHHPNRGNYPRIAVQNGLLKNHHKPITYAYIFNSYSYSWLREENGGNKDLDTIKLTRREKKWYYSKIYKTKQKYQRKRTGDFAYFNMESTKGRFWLQAARPNYPKLVWDFYTGIHMLRMEQLQDILDGQWALIICICWWELVSHMFYAFIYTTFEDLTYFKLIYLLLTFIDSF